MPVASLVAFAAVLSLAPQSERGVEKQLVATIGHAELKGGLVSEIMWDGGLLVLQGVFAEPTGELKADYFVVPGEGIELKRLAEPSDAAVKYWRMKASRTSPTGLGRIVSAEDRSLPVYGVGDLTRRVDDAVRMGGTQTRHVLRLGSLVLLERTSEVAPYDGETWSWSPPELNRIAYVDGKGDLWVATCEGARPRRLFKGDFSLPAWSEDGRLIAVVERKDNGKRWEISVLHLPAELSAPRFPR